MFYVTALPELEPVILCSFSRVAFFKQKTNGDRDSLVTPGQKCIERGIFYRANCRLNLDTNNRLFDPSNVRTVAHLPRGHLFSSYDACTWEKTLEPSLPCSCGIRTPP